MSDGRASEPEAWATLLGLIKIVEAWAVRVAATLRLADNIVNREGDSIDDLAVRVGADPDALGRLMRFLVARGVFNEPWPRVSRTTPPPACSKMIIPPACGAGSIWKGWEGQWTAPTAAFSRR